MNHESLPEILKEIDCIQETQQHSVVIEHNWCINDICELIQSKRPGEKIESEQFSYKNNNAKSNDSNTNDSIFDNLKDESHDSFSASKLKKKSFSSNNVYCKLDTNNRISYKFCQNQFPLHSELVCDYFLKNSLWRLEIAQSSSDLSFVSVNVLMFNSLSSFMDKTTSSIDTNLLTLCQNCDQLNLSAQLKLKLKFYLFNNEMNDMYIKQTFETNIDLKKFLGSLAFFLFKQTSNKNKPKLVEKFRIDKFCPINDLLKWLNKRNSNDFCLLTEFKIYSETKNNHVDPNILSNNSKSRLKKKLNKFQMKKISDSNSVLTNSSISSSCLYTTESLLVLGFKHAWTIKSWQNFLMPSSTSHTFMNDLEISNIFSGKATKLKNIINIFKIELFVNSTYSFTVSP